MLSIEQLGFILYLPQVLQVLLFVVVVIFCCFYS